MPDLRAIAAGTQSTSALADGQVPDWAAAESVKRLAIS